MNNNLTWKISTGVLAIALVALNVVAPAYEKKQSEKLVSGVVEYLGGYETATPEEKQAKLSSAMTFINESSSNEADARADFQASNGAYTTGDCVQFLNAALTVARAGAPQSLIDHFFQAYGECNRAPSTAPETLEL